MSLELRLGVGADPPFTCEALKESSLNTMVLACRLSYRDLKEGSGNDNHRDQANEQIRGLGAPKKPVTGVVDGHRAGGNGAL